MPLIKPAPWGVNRAAVGPEWDWFWKNASHAAIYNEGTGTPYDFAARQMPSTFTGWEWGSSPWGAGITCDAASDRLIYPARPGYNMDGDVLLSAGVVMLMDSNQANGGFIAHRDASDPGYWELYAENSGADVLFAVRTSGDSHETVTWVGANPTLAEFFELHTFFVSHYGGGVYELWVDGVSQGTQTNVSAIADPALHNLEIGRRGNNSTSQTGTYLFSFLLTGYAMSSASAAQLHNDFYGPFRPATVNQVSPTTSLFATADGTIVDVVNESDAASPLSPSIDDDPASPTDTDWINNAVDVT